MFTYSSSLESGSPRFSIPGDFFTYVIFVGVVILVSDGITYPQYSEAISHSDWVVMMSLGLCFPFYYPSHLAYLPAQPFLAEAVPGSEEDQPCTSYRSYFSQPFGLCAVQDGGKSTEIACVNLYFTCGGYGALHFSSYINIHIKVFFSLNTMLFINLQVAHQIV